jgi:hypothetical protein
MALELGLSREALSLRFERESLVVHSREEPVVEKETHVTIGPAERRAALPFLWLQWL